MPVTLSAPPIRRRRALLTTAAVAAVVAAEAVRPASAEAATDQVVHLLRRATYGPTPALISKVRTMGTTAWLEAQLAPTSISDSVVNAFLARMPRLNLRTWEVRETVPGDQSWDFMVDTIRAHQARAIWSERQLYEVVVDFWANHLVVPMPSSEAWDSGHLFQRDVIRKYAFGKYADMLAASLRHPALLQTLGNAASTRKAPNENHGRELLELHTVGIGNYTEADVRQSALALSGLSVDDRTGLYEFRPDCRYVGALQVLDWKNSNSTPEGGESVALSYASYLARHPATARRIATKLAVRFVSDTPPSSLIEKLAAVYLANDTAIVPVLRALFTSDEFAASAGQKIRTPYEDAIATLRLLGVKPETSGTHEMTVLLSLLMGMGHAPLGWPAPNGYPDVAAYWSSVNGTLTRWNFHICVAAGWTLTNLPKPALTALLPKTLPTTHGAFVDALAASLLIGPLTTAQRVAVCTFMAKDPASPLKAGDPAVTYLLPLVVGLLLDTPAHWTR